jgi:hypothetical protein
VIEDGQKDEDPLEHADQGQAVEELDLRAVGDGAFEGLKVREQVLEQEGADGDDAEQRVQLAPDEGGSLAGAQGLDAAADSWGAAGCWAVAMEVSAPKGCG